MRRDLTHPLLIYLKGSLFLVTAILAGSLIIAEMPSFRIIVLLCITVWAAARAYYFAFYVIDRYIGPHHRVAGIWDAFGD